MGHGLWILAGIFFTYSNYAFAKMAVHVSNLQTVGPKDNPWIPIISSAIALGFAIIAYLKEHKK